jgi:hypothetical protein
LGLRVGAPRRPDGKFSRPGSPGARFPRGGAGLQSWGHVTSSAVFFTAS